MIKFAGIFFLLFSLSCGSEDNAESTNNSLRQTAHSNLSNSTNNEAKTNNNTSTNNETQHHTQNTTSALNYYSDVKPIIDGKCIECHVEGGIAPFSLTTFEEVFSVRALVSSSVKARSMPPFLPGKECNEYQFDPSLSEKQINTITEWATLDAKMGDKNKEAPPLEKENYTPPVLDTVLKMATPYTPKLSPDDYRCFVIDWPHDSDKFITGFGVTPGAPSIVHHMIAFLATPENAAKAEQLDADEEGPGYTCFGDSGLGDGAWLGSWAPGGVDFAFPEGTGARIRKGSKVVLQIHYNTLEAKPVSDQSIVKFRTANTVKQEGFFMPWANPGWLRSKTMKIPAGNADVSHRFSFDPTQFIKGASKVKIYSGGLHMHLLGSSIKTWIQRENGDEDCMIDVPKWDFNWQAGVSLKKPMVLNKGDELALECHWDNSAANQPVINGKKITPKDRNWGEGTTDEMCLGVYYITVE